MEPDAEVEVQGRLRAGANHHQVRGFHNPVLEPSMIKHRGQFIQIMTAEEAKEWDVAVEKMRAEAAAKKQASQPPPTHSGDDSSPTMASLFAGVATKD